MDTGPVTLVKAAVVLNSAAGALLYRSDASAALTDLLAEAEFEPHFIPPEAGTLAQRMEAACKLGAPVLIVAGGDGTIACAVNAMQGTDITLGILPFGTMNVLAVDLGIPVGNVAAAVALLRDGQVRAIDAASVNGLIYLCGSMLGLPARLARYREAGRGKGSMVRLWLRFARAAFRAFARYGTPRAVLAIDGRIIELRAAALNITPGSLNDSSGRIFGRQRLDEGVLGVYAIRHITLLSVIRIAFHALIGRLGTDRDISGKRAREVVVTRLGRRRPKFFRVMNDGEVSLMAPPLTYRILPGVVRVIAPPSV
jgi:diacylglycerol kinase family enzyme